MVDCNTASRDRLVLRVALPSERQSIYRLRHAVYAKEIGQHPVQASGRLSDALDEKNIYLAAQRSRQLCGFISITPPRPNTFSLSKYLPNQPLPFALADTNGTEIRACFVENFRQQKGAMRVGEECDGRPRCLNRCAS